MPDERKRSRIDVEVDATAEPIAGRVRREGGPAREFHGWLGLASELERARRTEAEPAGDEAAAATSNSEEES
jgi:hypothetical protein